METDTTEIVQIPEKFETVLALHIDKPNWFLRYGLIGILFFISVFAVFFYPYYTKSAGFSTLANIKPKSDSSKFTLLNANRVLDTIYVPNNSFVKKSQILLSYYIYSDSTSTKINPVKFYLRSGRQGWLEYRLSENINSTKVKSINFKWNSLLYEGSFYMPFASAKNVKIGDKLKIDTYDLTSDEKLAVGNITAISHYITPDQKVNISFSFKMSSFRSLPFFFDHASATVFVNTIRD